jgi:hypothetical protein
VAGDLEGDGSPGPSGGNGNETAGVAGDREPAGSQGLSGGNGNAPALLAASGDSSVPLVGSRYLVVEGITDCWYLDAISSLVESSGRPGLDKNITLYPAHSVSNIMNCVIKLQGNLVKTAALFDSDDAGDQAFGQLEIVGLLGMDRVLRVSDFYLGTVKAVEMEELLRETLVNVAKKHLAIDVTNEAANQNETPITDIFNDKTAKPFKKTMLASTFVSWAQASRLASLTGKEQETCKSLIEAINMALA